MTRPIHRTRSVASGPSAPLPSAVAQTPSEDRPTRRREPSPRGAISIALRAAILGAGAGVALGTASGCSLIAAGAAAIEREKKVEVPAEYTDLANRTVAVVVQADMGTLYEHPTVASAIASNVSGRLQTNVEGIRVRNPRDVVTWQYQTPGWASLPYGDIAKQLDVERVIFIDVYEYRLNPIGNRYLWEGVCAANVGVIEREGLDPDTFVETFNIVAKFPTVEGVTREAAQQSQIETGLMMRFIEETSWLFYMHIAPKYPDRRADQVL